MNLFRFIKLQKNKNNKLLYYFQNVAGYYLIPKSFFQKRLSRVLSQSKRCDMEYVMDRVNYYNKLEEMAMLSGNTILLSDFRRPKKRKGKSANSVYFFDLYKYTRYFSNDLKIGYISGDVTHIPDIPSIVKSRPISAGNENSILMKMNKVRHFLFVDDKKSFQEKREQLIGRAGIYQPHRIRFMEMYFGHPLCDLGQINKKNTDHPEWTVEPMSIAEHLDYKFVLCLEGNDVATNLKWVMSSNSLAVMPRPRYETWFMEGRLIPNVHYVEIKADYSDLEERLNYYIQNPGEALKIIENAHQYIAQFRDKKREGLISLLTLRKYFEKTGQL